VASVSSGAGDANGRDVKELPTDAMRAVWSQPVWPDGSERLPPPARPLAAPDRRAVAPVRWPAVTTLGGARRANVIGLGLIGGSIALGLREQGWYVTGDDQAAERAADALARGCVDATGLDADAAITFVAVPVLAVVEQVKRALADTTGVVTDVGSVKGAICDAIRDPRFVGGHPMAGSELEGLDGADAAMFTGAVWVLTPRSDTPDTTFASVARAVTQLGAEVVALDPARHDEVVAVVSHVPHLAAAGLMGLAADRAEDHAALLRLAAGGFRDMTRIASGHPEIWLDICAENRPAILTALDGLLERLTDLRRIVGDDEREQLHARLQRARDARTNLPTRGVRPEELAEVRIPIPDRPGAAAEVFTLAAELGVNVDSFEVVHHAEGTGGVAVVLVDVGAADLFRGGLIARGFRPAVTRLS
jgi:prephenate dehydrogenase